MATGAILLMTRGGAGGGDGGAAPGRPRAPGAPVDPGRLRAFVIARGAAASDADDIVQETFARVLEGMARETVRAPTAYAYRVADNLVRRTAGYEGRFKALSDDLVGVEPSVDAGIDARRVLEVVRRALRRMPRRQREALLQHRLDGLTHAQIAADHGMTPAAAQKLVSRAAQALVAAVETDHKRRMRKERTRP